MERMLVLMVELVVVVVCSSSVTSLWLVISIKMILLMLWKRRKEGKMKKTVLNFIQFIHEIIMDFQYLLQNIVLANSVQHL